MIHSCKAVYLDCFADVTVHVEPPLLYAVTRVIVIHELAVRLCGLVRWEGRGISEIVLICKSCLIILTMFCYYLVRKLTLTWHYYRY